jgi:hypothetical protein
MIHLPARAGASPLPRARAGVNLLVERPLLGVSLDAAVGIPMGMAARRGEEQDRKQC